MRAFNQKGPALLVKNFKKIVFLIFKIHLKVGLNIKKSKLLK